MSPSDDAASMTPIEVGKGYVALIMAESILHMLIEKNLIRTEDALATLQSTVEVTLALAAGGQEPPDKTRAAIDAVFQMMDSLAVDLGPEARLQMRSYFDRNSDMN